MIAVIALKRKQYDDFIKHWVDREDWNKFFHLQSIDQTRGRKIAEIIRIGNYYELHNYQQLYDEAKLARRC